MDESDLRVRSRRSHSLTSVASIRPVLLSEENCSEESFLKASVSRFRHPRDLQGSNVSLPSEHHDGRRQRRRKPHVRRRDWRRWFVAVPLQGSDPDYRDNVGLREAMTRRVPLICFHGIVEGKYEAEYPVFVVGEQLLEAVHIVGDREAIGFPIVPTGIALCALHHGAFDGHLMTVRPDYRIEVRRDLLEESDGPTLIHGLQGFHGQSIGLPPRRRLRPDAHLLEIRYERVREVSRSA